MKTLWEKNNLITSNTLFNNVSYPINDIDLYSVLCNHLKTKKKKKDVTQNIKFVCLCVDNIFFPKFDIIRDKYGKFSFGVKVEYVTFKYTV